MIFKRNLLRDLWDREETKIVLVLAVALVLAALFFCWSSGDTDDPAGGETQGRGFPV